MNIAGVRAFVSASRGHSSASVHSSVTTRLSDESVPGRMSTCTMSTSPCAQWSPASSTNRPSAAATPPSSSCSHSARLAYTRNLGTLPFRTTSLMCAAASGSNACALTPSGVVVNSRIDRDQGGGRRSVPTDIAYSKKTSRMVPSTDVPDWLSDPARTTVYVFAVSSAVHSRSEPSAKT